MEKKILVALKRPDEIDKAVTCLKEVVKPGMSVVFLIPYPVEPRSYLRDHWVEAETAREAMAAGTELMSRYSWEAQKELAEQKVFLAREVLRKRSVDVQVQLYTGKLRRTVQDFVAQEDIDWIVTTAQASDWVSNLLAKALARFGSFKRARASSIWLLYSIRAHD